MKQIHLKEMYDAGVHLGSNIKKINPKMRPYIMCVHDGIAILDILKTYTRLFRITLFLKKVIATEGYRVLFVGTQKSIAPLIAEIANKSSSNYINERWKGGFLTNFKTMKKSEKISLKRPEKNFQEKLQYNNEKDGIKNNQSMTEISKNNARDNTTSHFMGSNELNSLPDLVIIVGQEKELKAIKECQKLNIPIITILDSDGDPTLTSLFIPANDDSRASVEFILKHLGQSILVGRLLFEKRVAMNRSINKR